MICTLKPPVKPIILTLLTAACSLLYTAHADTRIGMDLQSYSRPQLQYARFFKVVREGVPTNVQYDYKLKKVEFTGRALFYAEHKIKSYGAYGVYMRYGVLLPGQIKSVQTVRIGDKEIHAAIYKITHRAIAFGASIKRSLTKSDYFSVELYNGFRRDTAKIAQQHLNQVIHHDFKTSSVSTKAFNSTVHALSMTLEPGRHVYFKIGAQKSFILNSAPHFKINDLTIFSGIGVKL